MANYVHNNNVMVVVRGDTFEFDLTIEDEESTTGRYILKDEDVLYFGLMDPNQLFEDALIKQRYTKDDLDEAGNLYIKLSAEDTESLAPGRYYYSIKLHRLNTTENIDRVMTIIPNTKLVIVD